MTQTALSHSQLGELPRRRMIAPKLLGVGAMIAACLLLLVAPTFQWQPSIGNTAYNDVTDDNSEMVDLVMLDTFERF